MERRIVFATGNENKMTEIRMILSDLGMPVYSMKELGVEADIVEDGISFEERNLTNFSALSLCFVSLEIAHPEASRGTIPGKVITSQSNFASSLIFEYNHLPER